MNVTVSDLLSVDLAGYVQQLLELHLVPPSSLVIEVTEEAFMHEPERVRGTLLSLHKIGVELSIDDFGTGYSSMAYLRSIPADELKLDRTFMTGIASDAFDPSVVVATVGLAHSLGMRVVAEGVESPSDIETLSDLGCDVAQGHFLSRPLSVAAFEEWLAARSALSAL